MWVGAGRPGPRGWLLYALLAAQSAASIVVAYLRLAQREWHREPPLDTRLRAGAPALALAALNVVAVAALVAFGFVPGPLLVPFLFRLAETLEGVLRPAVDWKPRRIGFRLLGGAVIATALFALTWR